MEQDDEPQSEDAFLASLFADIPGPAYSSTEARRLPEQPGGPEEGLEHSCESCGTEVFRKSNRGRWPKYCPECKGTRTGGTPRKAPRITKNRLDSVQENLGRLVAMCGLASSRVSPTGGYVMMERAPKLAHAVVELAKNNEAVMAALEAMGKTGPSVDIAECVGAIVLGFAVDFGKAPVNGILPQFLGVTEAYIRTHEVPDTIPDTVTVGARNTPPPIPDLN